MCVLWCTCCGAHAGVLQFNKAEGSQHCAGDPSQSFRQPRRAHRAPPRPLIHRSCPTVGVSNSNQRLHHRCHYKQPALCHCRQKRIMVDILRSKDAGPKTINSRRKVRPCPASSRLRLPSTSALSVHLLLLPLLLNTRAHYLIVEGGALSPVCMHAHTQHARRTDWSTTTRAHPCTCRCEPLVPPVDRRRPACAPPPPPACGVASSGSGQWAAGSPPRRHPSPCGAGWGCRRTTSCTAAPETPSPACYRTTLRWMR